MPCGRLAACSAPAPTPASCARAAASMAAALTAPVALQALPIGRIPARQRGRRRHGGIQLRAAPPHRRRRSQEYFIDAQQNLETLNHDLSVETWDLTTPWSGACEGITSTTILEQQLPSLGNVGKVRPFLIGTTTEVCAVEERTDEQAAVFADEIISSVRDYPAFLATSSSSSSSSSSRCLLRASGAHGQPDRTAARSALSAAAARWVGGDETRAGLTLEKDSNDGWSLSESVSNLLT